MWNLKNLGSPQLIGDSHVYPNPEDSQVVSDAAWIGGRWVVAVGDTLLQSE
jgi:hypothetical protein